MRRLPAAAARAATAAGLAAAAALATLLAAEGALRLFWPQTLLHDPDAFDPDPVLGGRLKPGFADAFDNPEFATRWAINARGHRGPPAGPKPAGAVRVAAVGDSYTFGYGVEEPETYPRALEREMARRVPRPVEVINLGVGGYGTVQELVWLSEHLDRGLDPDLVVLGFYMGNDVFDNLRGAAARAAASAGRPDLALALPAGGATSERWKRRLASHLHLYSLVSDRADGLLVRLGLRNVVYAEEVNVLRVPEPEAVAEAWAATAEALAELRALAGARGFRPVVMAVPMRHQVVPAAWDRVRAFYERLTGAPLVGADLDAPRRRIAEICAREGLDLLDLTDTFRADPDPARLHFKRDQHWTREGHALAARTLAGFLALRLEGAAAP